MIRQANTYNTYILCYLCLLATEVILTRILTILSTISGTAVPKPRSTSVTTVSFQIRTSTISGSSSRDSTELKLPFWRKERKGWINKKINQAVAHEWVKFCHSMRDTYNSLKLQIWKEGANFLSNNHISYLLLAVMYICICAGDVGKYEMTVTYLLTLNGIRFGHINFLRSGRNLFDRRQKDARQNGNPEKEINQEHKVDNGSGCKWPKSFIHQR